MNRNTFLNKMFSRIGVSYFLLAFVTIILVNLISSILYLTVPDLLDNAAARELISLAPMYLIAFPVCGLCMKKLPKMHIFQSDLSFQRWFAFLCMCLFVMVVGNLMGNAVVNIISNLTSLDIGFDVQEMMMEENLLSSFLFSVILAPVLEELMFRKVLLDRAVVLGDRTAILLSGFLFGLFHGNFYQLFYTFGLGCMFAYIYLRTGKIRNTIALHMTINCLGGFLPTAFMRNVDLDRLIQGLQQSDMDIVNYVYAHLGSLLGLSLVEILIFILGIIGLVRLIVSLKHVELREGQYSAPGKMMAKRMFGNVGIWLFIAICVYMFVSSIIN